MSGISKPPIAEAIDREKFEKSKEHNYATDSIFCMSVTTPFRVRFIKLVNNPWFDRTILVVIVANCIFLAMDNPREPQKQY